MVDGAYPYDWLDDAMEQRIRKLFRRLGWFMSLLRPTGLTPRMTAEQQVNSNIELGVLPASACLAPCWTTSLSRCGMWVLREPR